MFGLGTREIVLLVIVIVLLFGSKKIPELTRSVVDSIRHLRGAFKDEEVTTVTVEDKKRV